MYIKIKYRIWLAKSLYPYRKPQMHLYMTRHASTSSTLRQLSLMQTKFSSTIISTGDKDAKNISKKHLLGESGTSWKCVRLGVLSNLWKFPSPSCAARWIGAHLAPHPQITFSWITREDEVVQTEIVDFCIPLWICDYFHKVFIGRWLGLG